MGPSLLIYGLLQLLFTLCLGRGRWKENKLKEMRKLHEYTKILYPFDIVVRSKVLIVELLLYKLLTKNRHFKTIKN